MKILHICLANYYADNHSYQENILPVEHKKLGYEVEIIASTEFINHENKIDYRKAGKYYTKEKILITRLDYALYLPFYIKTKLRFYKELTNELELSNPDIIFIHDVQFCSCFEVTRYVKKNRYKKDIKVFADCHADFTNSARNWLSYHILHKIIYKQCALNLNKVVDKFWGVLPDRVKFLNQVYNIPGDKIGLLNLGVESSWSELSNKVGIKKYYRKKLGIGDDDFIIFTGGRIDYFKRETLNLMSELKSCKIKNLKLIIFGTISIELQADFNRILEDDNRITFCGFIEPNVINEIIIASDIGIFLGRHSVMWENAVGLGIPLILGQVNNVSHLNHNGNIINVSTASEAIEFLNSQVQKNTFSKLNVRSLCKSRNNFCYKKIAIKCITF